MIVQTIKNLLRCKTGDGKPLIFLSGSKEELQQVTQWMCHANPTLFKQDKICISYDATNGQKCGEIQFIGVFQQMLSSTEKMYLQNCCTLILKHNQFSGTQWCRDLSTREQARVSIFGYFEWPLSREFLIARPTQLEHEQALQAWSKWLAKRVNLREKQELLQFSEKKGVEEDETE